MIVKSNQATKAYYFKEGCYIKELWNTSDDNNVSIAHVRLPTKMSTRLHKLQGISERYVILQGKGLVETSVGKETVVSGDVVYILPDEEQMIKSIGDTDLVFLAICHQRFQEKFYIDCEQD